MRLLACALVLCGAVPVFGQGEKFKYEEAFDFRGGKFDPDLLRYMGPTPDKYLTSEEQGLRLRYTGSGAPPASNTVGVAWKLEARGDFVAMARYEVLQMERAEKSNGVGVELYLRLKGPAEEGIAVARSLHPKDGLQFTFNYLATNAEKKRSWKSPGVRKPTDLRSMKGAFRMERKGTTLIVSLAEGSDGPFNEFHRTEIGTSDVGLIRFAGLAGGDPTAVLDFRMLEFQLKGQNLGLRGKFDPTPPAPDGKAAPVEAKGPVPDAPAPAPEPAQTNGGMRWVYLLIVGLLLIPLLALAAIIAFFRLRGTKPGVEKTDKQPAKPKRQP